MFTNIFLFFFPTESIYLLVNRLTLAGVAERSQYLCNIERHLLITGMGPQVARVKGLSWAEGRSSTLVRVTRWTADSGDYTQCPGWLPRGGVQGRRNYAVVHCCNRQLQRSYKGMSISCSSPYNKPHTIMICRQFQAVAQTASCIRPAQLRLKRGLLFAMSLLLAGCS